MFAASSASMRTPPYAIAVFPRSRQPFGSFDAKKLSDVTLYPKISRLNRLMVTWLMDISCVGQMGPQSILGLICL